MRKPVNWRLTGSMQSRFWVDVMTARFNEIQARQGNPILVVGGGVTGVDLALGSLST